MIPHRHFVTSPTKRGKTRGRLCPKCRGGSHVIAVVHATFESRRRRECLICGYRWTTRERDDDEKGH